MGLAARADGENAAAAHAVLCSGEGGKTLGVKPTKALPLTLVEEAMDEPLQLAAVGEDGEAREAE